LTRIHAPLVESPTSSQNHSHRPRLPLDVEPSTPNPIRSTRSDNSSPVLIFPSRSPASVLVNSIDEDDDFASSTSGMTLSLASSMTRNRTRWHRAAGVPYVCSNPALSESAKAACLSQAFGVSQAAVPEFISLFSSHP
jgi:hypothetical protein